MSTEFGESKQSSRHLDAYSPTAQLALQARYEQGNGSLYDRFLCDYIGEPGTQDFPPIWRRGASGMFYSYNSVAVGQVRRSYSQWGNMVTIRHAEGSLQRGDELSEYFVASASLRSARLVEWRVADIERQGPYGKQKVILHLSDQPALQVVSDQMQGDDSWSTMADKFRQWDSYSAEVELDPERGCTFRVGGRAEPLNDIAGLVAEVNDLTEGYGLTPELDIRRMRAAEALAPVIPLGQIAV
jgi:hypothetical protein